VGLILRFFTALVILVAALSVQLWSRLEVRNAAVRLDAARSALALAHSEQDRLQVEVTVLRAPSRLGAIAAEQGLVAPARTLTLGGGRL
jgi:cell division protein FtsL